MRRSDAELRPLRGRPVGSLVGSRRAHRAEPGDRVTVVQLTSPYVDTRAEDLRFSLSTQLQPAVAERRVGGLDLRILGASHQVVVLDGPAAGLVETVAYLPQVDTVLPPAHETELYRMTSAVHELDRDELQRWVDDSAPRWTGEQTIVARFPGDPLALTVLAAQAGGRSWQSWHVYPQHGQVVHTRTVLGEFDDPQERS
ncbi:DUF2617 family protein [Yimella sp. cx-573]|nr:DUF2617 family protein [Yimella sp. cx-573]